MDITSLFIEVVQEDMNSKSAKKSSLIKEWLTKDAVPQSILIRCGNWMETFLVKCLGDKNKLDLLKKKGRNMIITVDGEDHQIDLLGQMEDGVLITREIKCNLDLDRGKTRDTLRREEQIERGLEEQFDVSVDGGIFCPFYYGTIKKDGKFGMIFGMQWFIDTFELDFTVEDFQKIGKSEKLHKLLGL
tara:strand:- start:162 stop:725 length:564 start_codon:yes stop_codon:yes gene_type:complete